MPPTSCLDLRFMVTSDNAPHIRNPPSAFRKDSWVLLESSTLMDCRHTNGPLGSGVVVGGRRGRDNEAWHEA